MLEQIRQAMKTKVAKIIIIFMVISLLGIGLGDLLSYKSQNVAKIGKDYIELNEFYNELNDKAQEIIQNYNQKNNLKNKLMQDPNFRKNVLDDLILQKFLQQETQHNDILVSEKIVVDEIAKQKEFLDQKGKFDENKFKLFLQNKQLTQTKLVENIAQAKAIQYLMYGIVYTSIPVQKSIIDKYYLYVTQQRKVTLYQVKIDNSVVTPNEIKESELILYHRDNVKDYTVPETRNVDLINISCSNKNIDNIIHENKKLLFTDEQLKNFYDNNEELFIQPKKIIVLQKLFSDKNKAEKMYSQLLKYKKQSQNLIQILQNKKYDFLKVTWTPEDLYDNPLLSKLLLDTPKNTLLKPIKTELGYQMFFVLDSINEMLPVYQNIIPDITQQYISVNKCELAEQLFDVIYEEYINQNISLEDVTKKYKIQPKNTTLVKENVTENDLKLLLDIENNTQQKIQTLEKIVFDLEKEQINKPILFNPTSEINAIVILNQIEPEREKNLDEVRGIILQILRQNKAAKLAQKQTEQIYQQIKDNPNNIKINKKKYKNLHITKIKLQFKNGNVEKKVSDEMFQQIFSAQKKDVIPIAFDEKENAYSFVSIDDIKINNDQNKIQKQNLIEKIENVYLRNVQDIILDDYKKYLSDKYPVILYEQINQTENIQ